MRRHSRAIVVSVAVLAAVIFLHRLSPDRWSGMADRIMHSLHGPGFAALAVLVLLYVRRRQPWPRNYLIAAATAFSVGLVSEAAQIPGPRDAQLSDLVVNSIGIIAGLGTFAGFDPVARQAVSRPRLAASGVVIFAALAYTFVPTMQFIHAWVAQLNAAPLILSFERGWERHVYSQPNSARPMLESAPPGWPIPGSTVARSIEAGRWGIFLSVEPPRDWSSYSKLSFVAATDADNLALAVGVWDMRPDRASYDNRHYERITVTNIGARYYFSLDNIPTEAGKRPFDLTHVGSLVFSASDPGSNAQLLLDDIRLEP